MENESDSGVDAVEFVAAILLGLAAIAIAWATFQSAQWGGLQDEGFTESVRAANNAVDLLQAADTIKTLDQSLFAEVLTSGVCGEGEQRDDATCELVLSNMSDEGEAAVDAWLSSGGSNPFESPAYLDPLYSPGEEEKLASQDFFDEALEADNVGDDYDMAATVLTAVLFFAGISVVITDKRIAWTLLAGSTVLLIAATVWVATLPLE